MDRNAHIRKVFLAEREIVKTLIDYALLAGFEIGVEVENDPENDAIYTRNAYTAFEMLGSEAGWHTDDAHIYLRSAPSDAKPFGWVYLVFGNDGWDVISDYTTNLQHIINQVEPSMNKWMEEMTKLYS